MKVKKGMYWHNRHKVLLGYCYDEDGRRAFIENNKPKSERKLRQRLFQRVKGKLPEGVVKAGEACDKACEAYFEAREAYVKAGDCDKACEAYDKASEACAKACKDHKEEIEKLHIKECPDCPWDGETIFPTSKEKMR